MVHLGQFHGREEDTTQKSDCADWNQHFPVFSFFSCAIASVTSRSPTLTLGQAPSQSTSHLPCISNKNYLTIVSSSCLSKTRKVLWVWSRQTKHPIPNLKVQQSSQCLEFLHKQRPGKFSESEVILGTVHSCYCFWSWDVLSSSCIFFRRL
jgi:hypothetical protein